MIFSTVTSGAAAAVWGPAMAIAPAFTPFLFDMNYIILVMLPTLVISGLASLMVKTAFAKYSKVPTRNGYTGAQAAQEMLDRAGIYDVRVVPTGGYLSDHYNPLNKTLALSEPVYHSTSVAAVGVACHEAGHAIQHANNYVFLWMRSALVPAANIGSSLGMIVMMLGLFLGSLGPTVVLIGAALFSAVVAFQIITLPVEFDASARAKRLVVEHGIIFQDEKVGVNRVLNAAAMTYVAAAIGSILTLLYFLMRAGLLGGRDD